MEGAAKNPGSSSGMMGSGIGLGMGVAMGCTEPFLFSCRLTVWRRNRNKNASLPTPRHRRRNRPQKLILFFPVGLVLLCRKVSREKFERVANGKFLRRFGWVLFSFSVFYFLLAVTGHLQAEDRGNEETVKVAGVSQFGQNVPSNSVPHLLHFIRIFHQKPDVTIIDFSSMTKEEIAAWAAEHKITCKVTAESACKCSIANCAASSEKFSPYSEVS